MATLLPEGKQRFTNSAGAPLVGGTLSTYDVGTNNPRTTYQDAAATTPNTNPIVLDARGEATVFWSGAYKVVLKDALGATIWTVDNVLSADQYAGTVNTALNAFIANVADASDVTKGDALMAVKQPYTGAVATTQHLKNVERLSARDFGAVGNYDENTGLGADDTVALQAAIDAVASNTLGRGVMYLPRGSYKITAFLSIPYGVSIKGDGGTSSTIHAVGCDAFRFVTYGYSIGSMFYEDFGVTATSGVNFAAFVTLANAATMDGLYFRRLRLYGWNQCFISQANWNCTVENCVMENVNNCVALSSGNGQSIGVRLINNRMTMSAGGLGTADRVAIQCDSTSQFTESVNIYFNQIYGFPVAIKLNQATFVDIVCNDIYATVTGISYVTAVGNYLVFGNYIETTGIGTSGAINSVETPETRVLIAKNHFVGTGGATIAISIGSALGQYQWNHDIDGNTCTGFAAYDLYMPNPGKNVVSSNRFMSTPPTNSVYVGGVLGAPIILKNNWLKKALYIDVLADLTAGYILLNDNVESDSFQSRCRSAAPVSGTWRVGDTVLNNAPATAGYIGFVCTVAGTPGTWKSFGLIA